MLQLLKSMDFLVRKPNKFILILNAWVIQIISFITLSYNNIINKKFLLKTTFRKSWQMFKCEAKLRI